MMRGLACPYNRLSSPIFRNDQSLREVIVPNSFAEALRSGLTPSGKPIALVRGHKRGERKRKDWVICDTQSGLQLIDSEQGLLLECPHDPPILFSGFSIRIVPYTWRRIGHDTFQLLTAGIKHVAVLEFPDEPCYSETKLLF